MRPLAPRPGRARIVGALSAGAIIEQGSNANGEWVRWEDGTQVCWSVIEKSNIDVVPSNYIWRSDNYTSPAAFSGDYVVMITQASANNESDFSIVCGIAFHNGLVSLYNTGGSNAQNYIGAIIQNGMRQERLSGLCRMQCHL